MAIINEYRPISQTGTTLTDMVGSSDGTITGADWGKDSVERPYLDFISGNSDTVDCGDLGNIKSVVILCNLDTTSENILQNNVNGISSSSGTLSYTDWDNAYVDGVDTNTITASVWHLIAITSTSDVACTNFELGNISTTYGDLKIAYVATYDHELTAEEIRIITEQELENVKHYQPVFDGCVSYWDFKGELLQDVIGGNTLTNNNTVTLGTDRDGNANAAADFEASNSEYLSITDANQTGLDLTTELTFNFWINAESALGSGSLFYLMTKFGDNGSGDRSFYVFYKNDSGTFKMYLVVHSTDSTSDVLVVNMDLSTSTWHHVSITWDGATKKAKFYLDGSQTGGDQTGSNVASLQQGDGMFTIASIYSALNPFDGKMSEVMVYNRELSANEIKELYTLQLKGKVYPYEHALSSVANSNLVNQYFFTAGSGTTLPDFAGSSDGTLAGASVPVWNRKSDSNGLLNFTGGNGASYGNYNRVELTASDFQRTSSTAFSMFMVFRSSKSDAADHSLFNMRDLSADGYYQIVIKSTETMVFNLRDTSGNQRVNIVSTNVCDGEWHSIALCYDGAQTLTTYLDGVVAVDSTSHSGTLSGNLYTANAKPSLGAVYRSATTNYGYDLTGDIAYFANYDRELTAEEIEKIYQETFIT